MDTFITFSRCYFAEIWLTKTIVKETATFSVASQY